MLALVSQYTTFVKFYKKLSLYFKETYLKTKTRTLKFASAAIKTPNEEMIIQVEFTMKNLPTDNSLEAWKILHNLPTNTNC